MVDLAEVREAIGRADASWTARETSMADRLRPGEEGFLGLSMSEDERMGLLAEAFSVAAVFAAPPPAIDWRDKDGTNYVSSIKDQSRCGACVAFATVASMESRIAIASNRWLDLSEAHLFFCGAGQACAQGWQFEPALVQARDTGVGDEANFPYTPSNQPCRNIPIVARVKPGWGRPVSSRARKAAIATSGPVIAGMRVFEDFGYYGGGVYRHVTGTFLGLHAVCVVGYDDEGQYWIAKNSWGDDWGEQGYFRIGYGQCGLDSEFPFYDAEAY